MTMTIEQIQTMIRDNREKQKKRTKKVTKTKKQPTKYVRTKQDATRSLIRAAGSRELLDSFLHEHGLEVTLL